MLPRSQRLNLRQQPEFFSSAQRYHTRLYTVYFQPAEIWSVACIIPKKIARLAVKRHLLKRRTLAVLQRLQPTVAISLVLVGKSGLNSATPADIYSEIQKIIARHV